MYCKSIVPAAAMTREAAFSSEMTSQFLWGEKAVIIGEENQRWYRIKNRYDHYEGCVLKSQVQTITEEQYEKTDAFIVAGNVLYLDTEAGQVTLTAGCILTAEEKANSKGEVKEATTKPANLDLLLNTASQFLNTSYLWGGRTGFGIDCSGLTQTVFRLHGLLLPRDAWQQAAAGNLVDFQAAARAGDLAFFDDAEGKIIHVGILIDNQTIIHASGKVRIDDLDHAGIINRQSGERTHKLRIIKRYF
jgi:gamma-D-glutamyl-L-lysine dipeptidyl-peptidase